MAFCRLMRMFSCVQGKLGGLVVKLISKLGGLRAKQLEEKEWQMETTNNEQSKCEHYTCYILVDTVITTVRILITSTTIQKNKP